MSFGYDESWDGVDNFENSGMDFDGAQKRIFWMKPSTSGEVFEKRIMFIDSYPYKVWQHSLWKLGKKGSAVCLKKNKLDDRGCGFCNKKIPQTYAGYFNILEIGDVYENGDKVVPWIGKEGNVFLFKKLICMKQGSEKKPGMLVNIKRKAIRHLKDFGYKLAGSVWDITRQGEMAEGCGNEYTFVERIPEEEWMDYLVSKYGASDKLNLKTINIADIVKKMTIPYDEIQFMIGERTTNTTNNTNTKGSGPRVEGASYGDTNNGHINDGPPDSAYDEAYETRGGKSNTAYVPPDDDSDIPF